jgi:hypothetical protein
MEPTMSLLDVFRFRPVIRIARELTRLNDNLESLMASYSIPTAKERRRILADAAAAEEAERREAAASPWLSTVFGKQPVPETELDHTIADLREREKHGEPVDLEEVLAAARAIEQEQSVDDEESYRW